MGLGVPFNIASYALLTHMIAHVTDLKPGDFVHTLGDAHVYLNHIEPLKVQLERKPKEFPKLVIKRKVDKIEDFKFEDFAMEGYEPHPKITMEMAVWIKKILPVNFDKKRLHLFYDIIIIFFNSRIH